MRLFTSVFHSFISVWIAIQSVWIVSALAWSVMQDRWSCPTSCDTCCWNVFDDMIECLTAFETQILCFDPINFKLHWSVICCESRSGCQLLCLAFAPLVDALLKSDILSACNQTVQQNFVEVLLPTRVFKTRKHASIRVEFRSRSPTTHLLLCSE